MEVPRTTTQLALAWTAVFVAGLVAGALSLERNKSSSFESLRAEAQHSALIFHSDDLRLLSAPAIDQTQGVYPRIRESLGRLQRLHPDVRSVSILQLTENRRAFRVLVSSQSPSAGATGQAPERSVSIAPPALLRCFTTGETTSEGPKRQGGVSSVYAYAPIDVQAAPGDILQLEVDGSAWRRALVWHAFEAASYAWLLLGLPLGLLTARALRARREGLIRKLSKAVEQSQSGILITSANGRIEFANQGLCAQLGYRSEELVGRLCAEFETPITPGGLAQEMLAEVTAGRSWEGEWVNSRKNGAIYPVRGVVSPVLGPDGEHLGYIAVMNDMTAQRRQQEELREAKDRAEAGDRAKGHFLATMSHEVCTPVHGIVGFTNLLLDTPLSPEQREYVQTIRTSGEALVQLTGDILDFSRIETGRLQLETAPCDVRITLEDALDIFAARASERKIELLHWVEPDVPAQLLLDSGRLRQVLVNLIGNGIKFTPVGSVAVTVRVLTGKGASIAPFTLGEPNGQMVAELEDGSLTLEFAVRDTGIGISQRDRSRLFQAFSQLDASSVKRYGGAGLGLAISRNLVRLMAGDIWLESEMGRGSTFYFTVRGRPPAKSEAAEASPISLAEVSIALAITHEGLCRELQGLFTLAGAVVTQVTPAELIEARWDFAVMDCSALSELELQALVHRPGWRADSTFGLVPVTLSTTHRQALRPHLRTLISKPVHHRTLLAVVDRARSRSRTANPSGLPAAL